jgi:beta-1,4-mannosyl-glycoprotein beta-1,4-N-acetylglucosaminyltransferase
LAGKVWDVFRFFNEFDMLELRLKTLWDHVDQFVLYEGYETFTGELKPLYFHENRERFRPWLSKIRRMTVPRIDGTAWERDYYSQDYAGECFKDADPEDIIFFSDCDEIWDPVARDVESEFEDPLLYGQRMFYYRLNMERVPRIVWYGSRRVRAKKWPGGKALRDVKSPVLYDAGWHFSFLGDAEFAKQKLTAYAHTELAHLEVPFLDRCITSGVDITNPEAFYLPVPVDETFPKPIIEDPARWQKWIRS